MLWWAYITKRFVENFLAFNSLYLQIKIQLKFKKKKKKNNNNNSSGVPMNLYAPYKEGSSLLPLLGKIFGIMPLF